MDAWWGQLRRFSGCHSRCAAPRTLAACCRRVDGLAQKAQQGGATLSSRNAQLPRQHLAASQAQLGGAAAALAATSGRQGRQKVAPCLTRSHHCHWREGRVRCSA